MYYIGLYVYIIIQIYTDIYRHLKYISTYLHSFLSPKHKSTSPQGTVQVPAEVPTH